MHIERVKPWELRSEASMKFIWVIGVLGIIASASLLILIWSMMDYSEIMLAAGPIVIILGYCLLLFFRPTIIATFDRQEQKFILQKKWIWVNQTKEYPLSAIKGVHVIRKGTTAKAYKYHKIKLEMHSRRFIPLSSQNYFPKANVQLWAKELIDFLFNEPRFTKPSLPELHEDGEFLPG
jgi:hypothetical protein